MPAAVPGSAQGGRVSFLPGLSPFFLLMPLLWLSSLCLVSSPSASTRAWWDSPNPEAQGGLGIPRDVEGSLHFPAWGKLGTELGGGGHPAMGMPVYPFLLQRPQVWESLGIGTSVSLGDAWGQDPTESLGPGTSMSLEDAWGQEPLRTGMSVFLGDI